MISSARSASRVGERLDDLPVVVGRDAHLVDRVPAIRVVDERKLDHLADERRQALARGDREDRVVEEEVLTHDAAEVAGSDRVRRSASQLCRSRPTLAASRCRSAARRVAYPSSSARSSYRSWRSFASWHADGRAAVRRRDDEILGLEHQQRLAHGCAADPELAGELLLLQALPGLEPPVDDRLADQLGCGHAGISNERVARRQQPRHAGNHTVCNPAYQPAMARVEAAAGERAAPAPARTAVTTQNASQPACAASAPSGGVQTPETTKTTVAATAKERPASSARRALARNHVEDARSSRARRSRRRAPPEHDRAGAGVQRGGEEQRPRGQRRRPSRRASGRGGRPTPGRRCDPTRASRPSPSR